MINILLTGPPGIGKTTVLNRIKNYIKGNNLVVGGVYCPELCQNGQRIGFKIIDLITNDEGILSHINIDGPRLGKYRVNLKDLDTVGTSAIYKALDESDFILIDEIAPMELNSPNFCEAVLEAFNSSKPVIAVIHKRSKNPFIINLKKRDDVEIYEITKENRNTIHREVLRNILN
ncbi:MAG: NTPase [Methanomicrobiales archaeon]